MMEKGNQNPLNASEKRTGGTKGGVIELQKLCR